MPCKHFKTSKCFDIKPNFTSHFGDEHERGVSWDLIDAKINRLSVFDMT